MPDASSASPPRASALPANEQVICSLFEGDFHLGLAALINSLVKGGFSGLFWIGYRGALPPWTNQLARRGDGLFEVGGALLGFEAVNGNRHFGQYKPEFLSSLIERGIARKYLWYFDPDITVRCDWDFYLRWVRHGVCLCQEITLGSMPARHPFRCEWMELACAAGWSQPVRQQERYYNSGFVGLDIVHADFLQKWMGAVRLANGHGVQPGDFQKRKRSQLFSTIDQDALNIATMYASVPFTTIGPEGMGFTWGGFTMWHSVGKSKPWRKKFLRSALRGVGPTPADKHFLVCADGPIHPYTRRKLRQRRASAAMATFLARFYRRDSGTLPS